ncbi:MAG TPA: hypothetical protein DHM37_01400 [Candidatus Cloacimonas sp.]|jgi:hypothetical protein|nr:hypothetical protein [Candidatus Cloacimonadota bacterium]HCX72351.1 hypothetical protein [Candidatus Cloacimonas sp.]
MTRLSKKNSLYPILNDILIFYRKHLNSHSDIYKKAYGAELLAGIKAGYFKKVKLTKTYDYSYELDKKDNWKMIKIGDFTIKRKIKY